MQIYRHGMQIILLDLDENPKRLLWDGLRESDWERQATTINPAGSRG
jgi:hypothetical protein